MYTWYHVTKKQLFEGHYSTVERSALPRSLLYNKSRPLSLLPVRSVLLRSTRPGVQSGSVPTDARAYTDLTGLVAPWDRRPAARHC